MKNYPYTAKVIFRKDRKTNEIIAFFPECAANYGDIMSYSHIGQHGDASMEYYYSTEKASPEEYADLYEELKRIYEPDIPLNVRQKLYYNDLTAKAWKN